MNTTFYEPYYDVFMLRPAAGLFILVHLRPSFRLCLSFEFIYKVHLPLASDLGGAGNADGAIRIIDGSLSYIKQLQLHSLLGRLIAPHKVFMLPEPLKEPILANINTILLYQLGQLPDQDGLLAAAYGIGEGNLWLCLLQLDGQAHDLTVSYL